MIFYQNSKRSISLVLILFLTGLVSASLVRAEEKTECYWRHSLDELGDVAVSPAHGDLEGYALAAAFLGGTAVALHNDLPWYRDIQEHRNPWQDKVMPVATILGDGFVQVGGLAALYKFGGTQDREAAEMALEGQLDAGVIALLLKFSGSTRPDQDESGRRWFASFGDTSFPSGHTFSAFTTATILGDVYHAEWLAYPVAALVAYSRVYNKNHWPADTVAGAGLGILVGRIVLAYHRNVPKIPGITISALPTEDGGKVVVSWAY
jgi:undecaprenyl-diphosphatase